MTQQDIVDLALEYGAKKPKWWPAQAPSSEHWQMWEDRVLNFHNVCHLPDFQEYIEDANRYGGHRV